MEGKLYKISSYLNAEELGKFKQMVRGRGSLTDSMFIREMLGFDVRPRGAPKGKREKTGKTKSTRRTKATAGAEKSRSSKRAAGKKSDNSAASSEVKSQTSLFD